MSLANNEPRPVRGRRRFVGQMLALGGGVLIAPTGWSRDYLTIAQAQELIWPGVALEPVTVKLDRAQRKSIQKASGARVRQSKIKAWKSAAGDWFIVDQVIGKHENIDLAVGISREGKVSGIEILVYRESYGHEIRNGRWRAQFHGRDHAQDLQLDDQIRNISGATLSCAHVTDGINRLTHTWHQVLQTL